MYCKCIFMAGVGLTVASCAAGPPPFTGEHELPVKLLARKINCEMNDAVRRVVQNHPWMIGWQGVYTITFKTIDTGNLGAATNTFPFILNKAASRLSLGAGANYKQVGTRTGTYAYNLNFTDVIKEPACVPVDMPELTPLVSGRIGFGEWMERAVTSSTYPDPKQPDASHPEQLNSIGHTFEFVVDITGSVSPTFVLQPAPVTLNPVGSLERNADNQVMVAFGKPTAAGTQQTKVDHFFTADQVSLFKEIESDLKQLHADLTKAEQDQIRSKSGLASANLLLSEKSAALTQLTTQSHIEKLEPKTLGAQSATLTADISKAQSAVEKYQQQVQNNQTEITAKQTEIARRALQSQALLAPQGTKITTTGNASSGTLLSADQNPYIAQTQLQLLFQKQRFQ